MLNYLSCGIKNLDRCFFRFVTIHACDGQTDGQTDGQNSHRYTASALHAARSKIQVSCMQKGSYSIDLYICDIITLFNSGTEFHLTFESDDIFRVCLVVLEDNEDFGIVDVVGDRVVPESGSRTPRRFYHIWTANHKLTGQHSTLEHVLDAVRVCWRVSFLS